MEQNRPGEAPGPEAEPPGAEKEPTAPKEVVEPPAVGAEPSDTGRGPDLRGRDARVEAAISRPAELPTEATWEQYETSEAALVDPSS